ncbi:MAG: hypothetical protein A3H93_15540 [Rhodocyclales bacterium RIFCSPLOWO2_02_FULL_63_24]|nr:MAG: hypothetical protein A3H93_15540 [Rhodocyclales bacterium RIFCSPLOWO2_02_FULL_63_24]
MLCLLPALLFRLACKLLLLASFFDLALTLQTCPMRLLLLPASRLGLPLRRRLLLRLQLLALLFLCAPRLLLLLL